MNELTTTEAEVMPTNSALSRREQEPVPLALFGSTEPKAILARATDVAVQLRDVITKQKLVSKIAGKEYPRCEAWTLLGTILGVFPVLAWTKEIEGGYEARVEAKTLSGAVVGAAEAICTRAEKNWSTRDAFALKSMAQTRATAKALRMPLGFVMSLSGFEPTPAEEMDSVAHGEAAAGRSGGKGVSSVPPTPKVAGNAPSGPANGNPEERKVRFIGLIVGLGLESYAQEEFIERHWILPTESLADIAPEDVPKTVKLVNEVVAKIKARAGVVDDPPVTTAADQKPDLTGCETITGVIEQISSKSGSSAKGPWIRIGVRIGETWASTFHQNLGEKAKSLEGELVTAYFKASKLGNDLVHIEPGPGEIVP